MTIPTPLEEIVKAFDEKFGGLIYALQTQKTELGEHLAIVKLKERYLAEHRAFLISSLVAAYNAGIEKAREAVSAVHTLAYDGNPNTNGVPRNAHDVKNDALVAIHSLLPTDKP